MSSQSTDTTVAIASTTIGSAGITIQMVMEFASLTAMVLNIFLALGGLVLLYFRIRRAWNDDRQARQDDREARKER